MAKTTPDKLILRLSCPDATGIVAAVTSCIAKHGGWIASSDNYSDPDTNTFFMREEIFEDSLNKNKSSFTQDFRRLADQYQMDWQLLSNTRPKQIAVFVTSEEHCLFDLMGREHSNDLGGRIACVVSNRETLKKVSIANGYDFLMIGDEKGRTQPEQYEQVIEQNNIDTIVLARYMQVLPSSICEKYQGNIINIHHSFLPSFKGAKPYHQAHARGVKLIGATCHYVTADLDEGPIIEQDVARIDHSDSISDLKRAGKDIEKAVLARGLRWHLEDRVFISGHRSIVLR